MPLLIIENGEWKEITEEEKKQLSKEEQEKTLYLDGFLKQKLDFAISQQNKNNDVVGIIAGDEGSGKSTMGGNIMRYVSKDKWNPKKEMIGADYEEGIEKISNAPQKGYLMFDEGNVFFLSTEIMKRESRDLHKIFSIFRQKCLFVLIVLPSFFRLSSYFALDRSRFLIRTYLKNGERSYFAYYGEKLKNKMYRVGKKEHNYKVVQPKFRGRYTKCYPLETKEYKDFKLKTLTTSITTAKKKKQPTPSEIKKQVVRDIIKENIQLSSAKLSEIIPLSTRHINRIKESIRKEDNVQ